MAEPEKQLTGEDQKLGVARLTFAESLRYLFSPFVLYFCALLYDKDATIKLTDEIGVVGTISYLVAGSIIYFVYRNLIFDHVIKWTLDVTRKNNPTYRRYLQNKYKISPDDRWLPYHSARAERFYLHIGHIQENTTNRAQQVRFSGSAIWCNETSAQMCNDHCST